MLCVPAGDPEGPRGGPELELKADIDVERRYPAGVVDLMRDRGVDCRPTEDAGTVRELHRAMLHELVRVHDQNQRADVVPDERVVDAVEEVEGVRAGAGSVVALVDDVGRRVARYARGGRGLTREGGGTQHDDGDHEDRGGLAADPAELVCAGHSLAPLSALRRIDFSSLANPTSLM